jgi:hypothetical protein
MTKRVKAAAATLTSKKSKLKKIVVLNKLAYLHHYLMSAAIDLDYFSNVEPRAKAAVEKLITDAQGVKSWIVGVKGLKVDK